MQRWRITFTFISLSAVQKAFIYFHSKKTDIAKLTDVCMMGERTLQSIPLPYNTELKPEIKCTRRIHLEIRLIHFFIAYNIVNTHVSSGKGLEGNRRTIWVSPLNLKLDYIVKKERKRNCQKSNTYKLLIVMISWPSYMWAVRIKAPLSYSYKKLCNVF